MFMCHTFVAELQGSDTAKVSRSGRRHAANGAQTGERWPNSKRASNAQPRGPVFTLPSKSISPRTSRRAQISPARQNLSLLLRSSVREENSRFARHVSKCEGYPATTTRSRFLILPLLHLRLAQESAENVVPVL